MKQSFLLGLLFLMLLGGCQEPAASTSPAAKTTTIVKPSAPATAPPTEPSKVDEKPKLDDKPASAPKTGDNPNRIYQLKDLTAVKVKAPEGEIRLWVMDTEGKEQEGMMWLTEKDVEPDQGMLFVFREAKARAFWMQNTLLPLDIIFLDAKGKVLNIGDGRPKDESTVPSNGDAQYVVELVKGNAKKFGIRPGTILDVKGSLKL